MIKNKGFTIVELLIVIVVIAVLAAIVTTVYSGIQAKARDTERQTDVRIMRQAVEAYNVINGHYPFHSNMNGNSVVTADWAKSNLEGVTDAVLVTPTTPSSVINAWSSSGSAVQHTGYSYYALTGNSICTSASLCDGYTIGWRSEADGDYKYVFIKAN